LPASATSSVTFEQQYGVGYYAKTTTTAECSVSEALTAPFGDWPFLQWSAHVKHTAASPLYYTANVGQRFLQLREGHASASGFGSLLTSTTKKLNILGYDVFMTLTTAPATCTCTPTDRCLDDCNPRPTFVLVLNGTVGSYTGSGSRFFGQGDMFAPDMLAKATLDNDLTATTASNGISLQFAVGDDDNVTLLVGYVVEAASDDWSGAQAELTATLKAYFGVCAFSTIACTFLLMSVACLDLPCWSRHASCLSNVVA
jgi:hypothetical protein